MKNKAQFNTIIILLTLFIFLVFPAEIIAREQLKSWNEKNTEECLSMFIFLGKLVPSNLYRADKKTGAPSKKVAQKDSKNFLLKKKVASENSGNLPDRQVRHSNPQESNIQYVEDNRKWESKPTDYSIFNYLIYIYLLVLILVIWKSNEKNFSVFHP
jgi:hypothetical protein